MYQIYVVVDYFDGYIPISHTISSITPLTVQNILKSLNLSLVHHYVFWCKKILCSYQIVPHNKTIHVYPKNKKY